MASDSNEDWKNPENSEIDELLQKSNTVAIVGLSSKPERASHQVAQYLINHGFDVIPINPRESEILNLKSFPDLKSVGRVIDIVDIFRKAEATPPIVAEAIEVDAGAVWLQEGIVSEDSYKLAADADKSIVMDRCIKKEHERMKS